MNAVIQTTVSAARSAEGALVGQLHRAADALDGVALDPLAAAVARLRESAAAAQSRLQAARMLAAGILADALAGFEGFEAEVAPAEVPALPEPPPAEPTAPADCEPFAVAPPAPESPRAADEVPTAVAANGPEAEAVPAPLSPAPARQEADQGGEGEGPATPATPPEKGRRARKGKAPA